MSYILKALRRAETERAKGSIPGLSSRHVPEPSSGRRLWPWLLVGAMAVNAAIIIFAIWPTDIMSNSADSDFGLMNQSVSERPPTMVPDWQRQDSSKAVAGRGTGNEQAVKAVPGQAQAASDPTLFTSAEGSAENSARSAGSEVAARLLPGALDGAPQAADWLDEPPSKPRREAAPVAAAPSEGLPTPQPKPLSLAARTLLQEEFGQEELAALTEEPLDFEEDFSDEEEDFANESLERPSELVSLGPVDESAATGEPAAYANVPVFWQMPHTFRSQVPNVKLAVHVYAPEDASRFVIIDRRRYREGDQVADEMLLEAILPDGVVLDYQGQRFRLQHN